MLMDGSRHIEVEFAYAHFDASAPRLLRIACGNVEDVLTLFLGSSDAFGTFQRIRGGDISPYTPLALKTFLCGAKAAVPVPEPLSDAITAMIEVFACEQKSKQDHDPSAKRNFSVKKDDGTRNVGGWAVPYFLTADGPHFASYCYSVSDPVFDRLAPGSLIPHGTHEDGGSSLSVTELGDNEGMVVYWLQLAGGTVWIRNATGYDVHAFQGRPSQFKAAAQASLGRAIDLWIGDQPLGPVRRLRILRDAEGAPTCTLADHGDGISFAVHNVVSPFDSRAQFAMPNAPLVNMSPIGVEVPEDKNSVRLKCRAPQELASGATLTACEVEDLLLQLAQARMQLCQEVPLELAQGTIVVAQIDPCWRTSVNVHPSLPGIMLSMRHEGYGWLSFLLPHKEAQNLGFWLAQNAQTGD